jgi:hypothetical protein
VIIFKLRRGTSAQWAAVDPILRLAEPGFDTDTRTFKIGDGITRWSQLGAISGEGAVGPMGPAGPKGDKGDKGDPGDSVVGPAGADGTDGVDGASAYDLAVAEGFVGTIEDWLASLQGEPGTPGTPGADGADGADYAGPTITVSSSAPSAPSIGDVWIDTSA